MRAITPLNNNGSIQLRFSVSGKRYGFNPVPGGYFSDRRDLETARAIAIRVQNDILAGIFDPSLDRYRLVPKAIPKSHETETETLLEVWDLWVDSLDLSAYTKGGTYKDIRRMISKASPLVPEVSWLLDARIAATTFNVRLSYLKSCLRWALDKGLVQTDPYSPLKRKPAPRKNLKPFSKDEMLAILEAFKVHKPRYLPFVTFLFMTGCRVSEAIGLTWGHFDEGMTRVTISEALPRDKGGNSYRRVRRGTKTGSIRVLDVSPRLRDALPCKPPGCPSDTLVFTTVRGLTISDCRFRHDHWVPMLKLAGVPYRKPHNTRHSLASHAIYQGVPMTGVAYLLGHSDTQMVMRTYGHLLNVPTLPDLGI